MQVTREGEARHGRHNEEPEPPTRGSPPPPTQYAARPRAPARAARQACRDTTHRQKNENPRRRPTGPARPPVPSPAAGDNAVPGPRRGRGAGGGHSTASPFSVQTEGEKRTIKAIACRLPAAIVHVEDPPRFTMTCCQQHSLAPPPPRLYAHKCYYPAYICAGRARARRAHRRPTVPRWNVTPARTNDGQSPVCIKCTAGGRASTLAARHPRPVEK